MLPRATRLRAIDVLFYGRHVKRLFKCRELPRLTSPSCRAFGRDTPIKLSCPVLHRPDARRYRTRAFRGIDIVYAQHLYKYGISLVFIGPRATRKSRGGGRRPLPTSVPTRHNLASRDHRYMIRLSINSRLNRRSIFKDLPKQKDFRTVASSPKAARRFMDCSTAGLEIVQVARENRGIARPRNQDDIRAASRIRLSGKPSRLIDPQTCETQDSRVDEGEGVAATKIR